MKALGFTISKKFGIGEIKSENDLFYQVYFEEIDAVKNLVLKSLTKVFNSNESAEVALDYLLESEENENQIDWDQVLKNTNANEEMNRMNSANQRPSSMR